ncbi:hypothetical protein B9T11_07820 [Wohlfahrtiimonas chitiniclastica]|uniref:phage tail assembly chaperone family protein, TAC n=1 Tax=Wohlfahrtiimonas chitiniclastica TaxID=400946 RepID=UPI000B999871|nr:phage tail assembly chaperone family protein, TAC [Wohlfahrtiimonas chitiniclastica]MBS7827368.1 phage tail assembly chaperone family protein, TAC [Wohlfahrtiimonas chitiniclastica]MBS7829197.1 phage tail assembly chaperone family protein, TAC [Wohlfahrtiimonas chitiniclastica]MBS7835217.1 phage tail assembly chaperone family protein, TAC [Wohlfahrtiimonas chitiniclastica]MBS7837185.1 phage tail assembly chaperone family protein, TAC [Wohlfahrtiimonas chitiniclastica]MBS7837390.1 phage tail
MRLEDLLLQNQVGQSQKRQIIVKTENGEETADVYVKILSCSDVMDGDVKTNKEALYNNVSKAILNEKGKEIFTIEQIAELPAYIWFQLLDLCNELNVTGKMKP